MPAPRPVTVHLVRHGQSTWNVEGRLQGQTAHPRLTALGQRQAEEAAAVLDELLPGPARLGARLFSSDLARAEQTAQTIATTLDLPLQLDTALREQGLGALESRLTSELAAEPTPAGLDVSEVRWGGGESIADVHGRVGAFFERVLPEAPRHLILVTHGDTLRVALAWLAGRSHREVEWDIVPNGSVTSVTLPAGRLPRTGV